VSLSILSALVDKSLVRRERSGRYIIHELLKRYAYEILIGQNLLAPTKASYCAYYISYAERLRYSLVNNESGSLALDIEYSNLYRALEWIAEAKDANGLLQISDALTPYWQNRGYIAEGRRWLATALSLSTERTPTNLRAHALMSAGILAWNQSDFDTATWMLT